MPQRPDCLLARQRRAEVSREREPELLPAVCPQCGGVIGLVLSDQVVWCRGCARWAEPSDGFAGGGDVA